MKCGYVSNETRRSSVTRVQTGNDALQEINRCVFWRKSRDLYSVVAGTGGYHKAFNLRKWKCESSCTHSTAALLDMAPCNDVSEARTVSNIRAMNGKATQSLSFLESKGFDTPNATQSGSPWRFTEWDSRFSRRRKRRQQLSGGSTHLWNVSIIWYYMVQYPRRLFFHTRQRENLRPHVTSHYVPISCQFNRHRAFTSECTVRCNVF